MAGTQEAAALTSAFTLLGRVVGDILVPYVRAFTQGIIELSRWIMALDPATKDQIRTWIAWGVAIAGLIALLPGIVAGIKLMVGAFALLTGNPLLGIIVLIAGIGVALDLSVGDMENWRHRSLEEMDKVAVGWKGLKGIMGGIIEFTKAGFSNVYQVGRHLLGDKMASTRGINPIDAFNKGFDEMSGVNKLRGVGRTSGQGWGEGFIEGIKNKIAGLLGGGGDAAVGAILGGPAHFFAGTPWGRIMTAMSNKTPLQVVHKVDVLSLDAVWQKMQTSRGMSKEEAAARELELMRRDIAWIKEHGLKMINPAPAWV